MSVRFRDFYLAHVRAATPGAASPPADLEAIRRCLRRANWGGGIGNPIPDGYAVVESAGDLWAPRA